MTWDEYFMNMVLLVASKSKDTNTKIGAVIVGVDNEIRSTGYNSFPRRLNDNVPERYSRENGEKYFWFEHAERNAIYNAARMGVSLKNCRMYTTGIPCCDCARAIIQSGIEEVIVKEDGGSDAGKWKEQKERTIQMFRECRVILRYIR